MIRILQGDARVVLPTLEAESVQLVVTSPPYYALRSYIADGDPLKSFEIGLEPTPALFVEHLVEVFRHVRRVLHPSGVLVVNMGDSYAGSGKGSQGQSGVGAANGAIALGQVPKGSAPPVGFKPKDLMEMPSRVAMALQADGWYLRSRIPWLKRNSMPESVTDRPATSVEYLFLFSRSRTYYWDADAVRTQVAAPGRSSGNLARKIANGQQSRTNSHLGYAVPWTDEGNGRNRRNSDWFFETWQGLLLDEHDDPLALVVNPAPLKAAHFASFPPKLVEPFIKAASRPGDTVLDPFSGAATTVLVADRLGRNGIGIDLKPAYVAMGVDRLRADAPLFYEGVVTGVDAGMPSSSESFEVAR